MKRWQQLSWICLSVERKVELAADLQMVDLGLRPAYSVLSGVTLRSNKLNSCTCSGEKIQILCYNQKIISQIISTLLFLLAPGMVLFLGERTGWKMTVYMALGEQPFQQFCILFSVSRSKADGGNSPITEGCNDSIAVKTCETGSRTCWNVRDLILWVHWGDG